MVAVAFVTQSSEGIKIANAQWNRIYENSGVLLEFFQDAEPARIWLQQQIDRRKNQGE